MISTQNIEETVHLRAKQDSKFRRGLIVEAAKALLEGDLDACEALLRHYIMVKTKKSSI